MQRRDLILLFLGGLLFYGCIAWFQHSPGYMDADYYYAGGVRLVQGQGFTETYLWNYLDNPQQLPHPSNGYWYPLASILAAVGMFFSGQAAFWSARLVFVFSAALLVPITALLTFQITSRRESSLAAGMLAIFSGFYAAFLPTTDNFAPSMLLGGLFFLLLTRKDRLAPLFLGLTAGLLNLARADGLIWLAIGLIGLLFYWLQSAPHRRYSILLQKLLFLSAGYLIVMGPWLARNITIWGTPFNPAGNRMLWMTSYEQTFAWPASQINFQGWLASGWGAILSSRMSALETNLLNTIYEQGGVILVPFILMGIWVFRQDLRIRLAAFCWAILLLVMSIAFPFAGSRGSFFHASAALQLLWYALSVAGLDALVAIARAHGRFTPAAAPIFRWALVGFMAMMTVTMAVNTLLINQWDPSNQVYIEAEALLVKDGLAPNEAVMVENPPGYFAATGRPAVIIPSTDVQTMRRVAAIFNARYLILEKTYYPANYIPVYQNPTNQPGLVFLGEFNEVKIFQILP